MRVMIWILGCMVAAALGAAPFEPGPPVRHAHAHNDYEHARPLFDALSQGFCSVEADIYLKDGQLLVSHEAKDLRPERTLQKLYLDPLRELTARHKGRVYADGSTMILLIDIKTAAGPTYAALKPVLQKYESMLTRFENGLTKTGAVTVILSGNRPRERLLKEKRRLAAFDGRLEDLRQNLPVNFMPLVSDSFTQQFPSAKSNGVLSAEDSAKFHHAIETAHKEGRLIRFWATRDDRDTWSKLFEAGADLVNTDDLAGLAAFLKSVEK